MADICGDNRFEIIESAKQRLIEATNIESRPEEMAVLDSILFRMWQMGWLPGCERAERTCKMSLMPCGAWKCSSCGTVESHNIEPVDKYPYPYCPNCGARVEGD